MDPADAAKLESEVEAVKTALKSERAGEMKSATERLNATWQEVAQRMYQQASSQPGAGGASDGGPQGSAAPGSADGRPAEGPGGDVADAEYEVLDGDKKKA
jgi:molecular chaperone DnaK